MGHIARRQNIECTALSAEATRTFWRGRGARKSFWSAQASQAIEKVDSARENPRKSKHNEPSSEAHFATEPRLADDIQATGLFLEGVAAASATSPTGRPADQIFAGLGGGAKISWRSPSNPLKRNDQRRFAAENGGKRRRRNTRIRAAPLRPETRRRPPRGTGARAADYSTKENRAIAARTSAGAPASKKRNRHVDCDFFAETALERK
jgi:hypothetical protein